MIPISFSSYLPSILIGRFTKNSYITGMSIHCKINYFYSLDIFILVFTYKKGLYMKKEGELFYDDKVPSDGSEEI